MAKLQKKTCTCKSCDELQEDKKTLEKIGNYRDDEVQEAIKNLEKISNYIDALEAQIRSLKFENEILKSNISDNQMEKKEGKIIYMKP